jgi:hypothetical protein
MKRRLQIACGVFLVGLPLIWVALFVAGSAAAFWYDGSYPTRYGLGVLALTSVIGVVMLIAGLDMISSGRDSK